MKRRLIFFSIQVAMIIHCLAQNKPLIVPANVKMPKDSLALILLLDALNGFLKEKEKPNNENTFVLKEELLETSVLLDEIKGIEKSNKYKDDNFFKCYLSNLVTLDSNNFLIQFSYIGIHENAPILRASFKVLAKREQNQFFIHSPLKYNTVGWKKEKRGNITIYYFTSLNIITSQNYFKTVEKYDKKLRIDRAPEFFYYCANFNEVLQLIGVDYKSDYNGRNSGSLNAQENGSGIRVDGTLVPAKGDFDPHDLWHSRLHKVIPTSIINKPVDEGTAYLYGGSWGLSWEEIRKRFKKFADETPHADWLALYNESKNFDEKAKYPLNVDYMINALFVNEIEKEKGFPAVLELLRCGKREDGNENYFKALEKITGINKAAFNKKINELIHAK